MRGIEKSKWLLLAGLLLVQGPGFSQTDQQSGSFILSGHPGQAPLIQLNGRPYVAVDALAQLMSGSLSYQGTQITLTLPTAAGSARNAPLASSACDFGVLQRFLKCNH